jgi:hypothetical protein
MAAWAEVYRSEKDFPGLHAYNGESTDQSLPRHFTWSP